MILKFWYISGLIAPENKQQFHDLEQNPSSAYIPERAKIAVIG